MKTIFVKMGGVKTSEILVKLGLSITCMCVISSIKAQNTFTTNVLIADSARVAYTRGDSISVGTVRTDSLCSAKDLCVHQDAKISGDVEVTGKVVAKSGILLDTNNVGIYKKYVLLPVLDSAQSGVKMMSMISAGPLSNGISDSPPIDVTPCEGGQELDGNQQGSGGFIAGAVRSNVVDATLGMWVDLWTGNGMLEVMGHGIYGADHGLYLNYNCGKNIYLGTGFGDGGTWEGKAGSKIYMGDYVEMRKKLQIGSPQWGIVNDPNNVALEVHTNSGTGIRAKTYTINDPMISVMNSNDGTGGGPSVGYNNRNTFVVYGDGKVRIRSLNIVDPIMSIGKFNNTNNTDAGTEYFRMYADGRTVWQSSGANVQVLTLNNGSNDVLRVYGDGKTIIGTQKVVGTHSDALLQVAGKAAAKSFYVLKPTTWADDVFKVNAEIDLKEIEEYIKEHKHLPGIPDENSIKQKGYDVNEMNALLLKKIEELYLIVIQQQKEIEKMKGR